MNQAACGWLLNARASLAIEQGRYNDAFGFYSQSLSLARRFSRKFDEASVLANLAVVCQYQERLDEAIDWLNASNRVAQLLNAREILMNNTGNLGWIYYRLGDYEKALAMYQVAGQQAVELGDIDDTIAWLTTSGYDFQSSHDLPHAIDSYHHALRLAKQINNKEDIVTALEDLAHASIDSGRLNDADARLRQLAPWLRGNPNRLDVLDVMLAKGRIAAARRQDQQAEALFRSVENDPSAQITMRLSAEHELSRLFEAEGRVREAKNMYRSALATFESEREQLKNEDSKLPFFANATPVYDDYIQFLMNQGDSVDALTAADQSRARTLSQGLGPTTAGQSLQPASWNPNEVARKTGATLLFYWLGEKRSWLWAITPEKTSVFPLPAESEIVRRVERYRSTLLGPFDPLESSNADGLALYRVLVAPASDLLRPGSKVVILCDGPLSELNFETLLVPQPSLHYWIEDADVVSAPSLYMLAIARPPQSAGNKLLLLGNAVSPGPDYPELPNAANEIQRIRKHFAAKDEIVLAQQQANPRAYLASQPQRFAYIDFVAHGVASSTDPLDSAIILSRSDSAEDSFKLYAREIVQRPIDARLVAISACYGSGTRSYAGEGLVGLSWAFLRAGAHNVIAALWEVSDDSTPRLMDSLYQGLEDGLPPSAALRRAKLALLHSQSSFRRPFFWAPFQIYTGM